MVPVVWVKSLEKKTSELVARIEICFTSDVA